MHKTIMSKWIEQDQHAKSTQKSVAILYICNKQVQSEISKKKQSHL